MGKPSKHLISQLVCPTIFHILPGRSGGRRKKSGFEFKIPDIMDFGSVDLERPEHLELKVVLADPDSEKSSEAEGVNSENDERK